MAHALPISLHDMFKRPEEIFLKSEVSKFPFFYKFHGQLTEGINGKECYIFIGVTPDLKKSRGPLLINETLMAMSINCDCMQNHMSEKI